MTEYFWIWSAIVCVALITGFLVGRRMEREEPSASDDELVRWMYRRRTREKLREDLERAYRREEAAYREKIERELAERKPPVKHSGADWTS